MSNPDDAINDADEASDYDEESIYGSEEDDESHPNDVFSLVQRNINYILHWRPPVTKKTKRIKNRKDKSKLKVRDSNEDGYYRNWFLPGNIEAHIVKYCNTRGLICEPGVLTPFDSSYQNSTTSFVTLDGDPPHFAQEISRLNAFSKRRQSTRTKEATSRPHVTHLSPPKRLPSQRSVRFSVSFHEGVPDEFTNRPKRLGRGGMSMTMHPYLYIVQLRHADFVWTVRRRYKHFTALHDHILIQKALLMLHVPTAGSSGDRDNLHKERTHDSSASVEGSDNEHRHNQHLVSPAPRRHLLPGLPRRYDVFVRNEDFPGRKEQLERYIQTAANIKRIRNNAELCKFLEVSPVSFIPSLGAKLKEGFILKQSTWLGGGKGVGKGRGVLSCCWPWAQRKVGPRYKRWLFLKETCLGYMEVKHWNLRDVLLFDERFSVRCGLAATGITNGLKLTTNGRSLLFKCSSERQMNEWFAAIHNTKVTSGRVFCANKRFNSFAPVRENIHIKWYVDGLSYFEALAKCLESATEQIFICDWWLSPEIHLKRPYSSDRYRVDHLLHRKAKEGVMVYILLYKEIEMTMSINSAYTKRTFTSLHRNIKVLRHPDHLRGGVLMWAHHEKIVIIDQKIAFLGGLDICFGRWDTSEHVMTDLGGGVWQPDEKSLNVKFDPPSLLKPGMEPRLSHNPLSRLQSLPGHLAMSRPTIPPSTPLMAPIPEGTEETNEGSLSPDLNLLPSMAPSSREWERRPLRKATLTIAPPTTSEVSLQRGTLGNVMEQLLIHASSFEERKDGQLVVKVRLPPPEELRAFHRSTSVRVPASTARPRHQHDVKNQYSCMETLFPLSQEQSRNSGNVAVMGLDIPGKKIAAKRMRSLEQPDEHTDHQCPSSTLDKAGVGRAVRAAKELRDSLRGGDVTQETQPCSSASDEEDESSTATGSKSYIWAGKDYVNWLEKDVINAQIPHADLVDRGEVPRMPWHDVGVSVYGRAARDAARHFIQRWNAVKLEKARSHPSIPLLLPKSYDRTGMSRAQMKDTFCTRVQLLRSACPWSVGLGSTEASILEAYTTAIFNSQHFVYFENQFFISSCGVSGDLVLNGVAKALMERILWAHKMGRPFRVYVNIPLLPAFEGQIGPHSGVAIQAIFHYMKRTLVEGPSSLFEQLRARQVDPEDYIFVGSLRNYGKMPGEAGRLVTEMVYVHSKLLLVDDRVVIVGSANVNDRSLVGFRDGEVALISEDTGPDFLVEGVLGGKRALVGKFAQSLRVALMREHLGVPVHYRSSMPGQHEESVVSDSRSEGGNVIPRDWDYDLLADPVHDKFFKDVWQRTARTNTQIYSEVFNALPCNEVTTYAELEAHRQRPTLSDTDPTLAAAKLKQIRGFLVESPLQFLKNENIAPKTGTKEAWLPYQVWC